MKKYLIMAFCFISTMASSENIAEHFNSILKQEIIKTGDVIVWGTNEMDSVIIQKFTEGPYSHAGIIWKDEEGKDWLLEISSNEGLMRTSIDKMFVSNPQSLTAVALLRYKGKLDEFKITERIKEFWNRKSQIKFDRSFGMNEKENYAALLKGESVSLYCTELIYWIYEGLTDGPVCFQNDYDRVYLQKDLFGSVPVDQEILYQFQQWLGIKPVEQFQNWLMAHKGQALISVNGMIRSNGFKVVGELKEPGNFKSWAVRFLQNKAEGEKDKNASQEEKTN